MITRYTRSGRCYLTNGDYSGDVGINVTAAEIEELELGPGDPPKRTHRVTIPFADLKEIVARYVAARHIRTLENAHPDADFRGVEERLAARETSY